MFAISDRAEKMKSSVIRELLKLAKQPGVISLAGGLPDEELFPINDIKEAADRMLVEKGRQALQYGTTEGYIHLREYLAKWMLEKKNIKCSADEILITTGSQQGLDLTGRVFINNGDNIFASSPTYLGAVQAFNAYYPNWITLPSDDDGMILDGFEEIIKTKKPKFIYQVPTFQNPDGKTMPLDRREKLVEIAVKYNVPIIEDDPYSSLLYTGSTPPALKTLAPEHVIYMSTFSKMVCPGFRVAWIVAPKEILSKFVAMKQGCDLHTSTLAQYLLHEYISAGKMDAHIEKIKIEYGKKMLKMKEAIKIHLPKETKVTEPIGGMFFWIELPKNINTTDLLPIAVKNDVAFVPGSPFHPDGTGQNTLRLNFSKPTLEEIDEGLRRLGKVIKEQLAK